MEKKGSFFSPKKFVATTLIEMSMDGLRGAHQGTRQGSGENIEGAQYREGELAQMIIDLRDSIHTLYETTVPDRLTPPPALVANRADDASNAAQQP